MVVTEGGHWTPPNLAKMVCILIYIPSFFEKGKDKKGKWKKVEA